MMILTASKCQRLAILLFGAWTCVQSCNTNKVTCDQLRDEAMEIRVPEEKCAAMKAYRECVRTDTEDCEGGVEDQYATNLVNAFCNDAYFCSQKLTGCFKDFDIIIIDINNSDNETRTQKCSTVVPPIMKCQENVMEECHGHSGILETITSYQATLNASCSNTIPCLSKIMQCQAGILDKTPADSDSQNGSVDCSAQDSIDNCGAYRQALECMKVNLTSCQGQFNMDNIIVTLGNTTQEVCNPVLLCTKKISKCMCHLRTHPSRGPLTMLMNICSTYDRFSTCLDDMDTHCREIPDVDNQVTDLRALYGTYYTLLCTRQQGLCPPAVQCFADLPEPTSNNGVVGLPDRPFDMDTLCLAADPVFECLEKSAKTCNEKTDKVTFAKLKDNFLVMCEDMAPHVKNISKCAGFQKCMAAFQGFKHGSSAASGAVTVHTTNAFKHMYIGVAKTDFWCDYMTHSFRCVAENAIDCSLGLEFASSSLLRYTEIDTLCNGPVIKPTTQAPVRTTKRTSGANPQFAVISDWVLAAALTLTLAASNVH